MPMPPNSARSHWFYRCMLVVWATLLVFMCVRSAIQHRATVWPIFAHAGQNWIHGANLYDDHYLWIDLDQYRYSPLVTTFFVPLSMLHESVGNVLWRLVNMAAFFAGIVAFCRTIYPGSERLTWLGAAFIGWLLVPLSLSSLNNGQANPLLIGSLLLAVVAVYHQRWNWATIALAVAILLKVYPLAIAMLLLLVYPRQLGWRLALVLAVGLLLPFCLQNPAYVYDQYQQWFIYLREEDRSTRLITESYRDFWILVRWADVPLPHRVYVALQLAVAAGLALVVLVGRMRGWPTRDLLRRVLDLGCCWIIVFGPATENCTFILIAPTLALAVWEGYATARPLWTRCLLAAIVGMFVGNALVTALPDGKNWVYPLNPLAALLLFGERLASLRTAQREPRAARMATEPAQAA